MESLIDPPFLLWEDGPALGRALSMRDVELRLSCNQLHEWQALLCSIRLPGCAKVDGPRVDIVQWHVGEVLLERVFLTCDPVLEGSAPFSPACAMVIANSVDDIVKASNDMQDPDLPLVLSLPRGLDFADAYWPDDGLRITANVTLTAAQDATVVLDFGLKTVLFKVESKSSATAFLAFRGCILVNLPLSYLPLDHPRRPFGILSTGLWPVYREQVAMGLFNCSLILTNEEFKFWSFWLSILISPIPAVRQLGNWSFASDVQLLPSGDDFIHLSSYYGRYTTLVDVRYLISSDLYTTQQRNNILQITGDEQVPPTVVFQVRNGADLLTSLVEAPTTSAGQYGQYIILTANISMPNDTSGVHILYPTTITTWPQTYATWDMQRVQDAFVTGAEVAIKNAVLHNLAAGPAGERYNNLTSGLWAFNISNWRTIEQQRLTFENAAFLVSAEEVHFYLAATVDWDEQSDRDWIQAFKVQSYDTTNRSWVFFSTLATLRFNAQRINMTSSMPNVVDMIPLILPASPGGLGEAPSGPQAPVNRQDVLLFATLCITLPTALGAIICTFIVLRRRRLSQLCTRSAVGGAAGKADGGDEDEEADARRGDGLASDDEADSPRGAAKRASRRPTAVCCVPLSLPLPLRLRKSKYINPLFVEPGAPEPEVLLTAVLRPAGQGQGRMLPPIAATEAAAAPVLEPGTMAPAELGPGAELEPHMRSGSRLGAGEAAEAAGACPDAGGGRDVAPLPELGCGPSGGRRPAGGEACAAAAGAMPPTPARLSTLGLDVELRWDSNGSASSTTVWLPPMGQNGGGEGGRARTGRQV
ncbi:hypothetical protein TSOC_011115 [Tetrabaena socialis]|uniref:Uncharacterized protein n=1 Tax=Tetrabaena socialis TaxID=47790 RepID=A0A2J7ZRH6_9CHLO|nr:hypothetical protein TSOC_011115 [Tetrabaena socialis]|eukprot:PNH02872.1 hypothetical protein TSOC_011115 [Tetrabaena socialis]